MVYHSAQNAISHRDERPTMSFATKKPNNAFLNMTAEQYKQTALPTETKPTKTPFKATNYLSVASDVDFKAPPPKPIIMVDEESLIKQLFEEELKRKLQEKEDEEESEFFEETSSKHIKRKDGE